MEPWFLVVFFSVIIGGHGNKRGGARAGGIMGPVGAGLGSADKTTLTDRLTGFLQLSDQIHSTFGVMTQ